MGEDDMKRDTSLPVSILTNKLTGPGQGPVPQRHLSDGRSNKSNTGATNGILTNPDEKSEPGVNIDENLQKSGISLSTLDNSIAASLRDLSLGKQQASDDGTPIISDNNTVGRKPSITSPKSTISFTVDETEKMSHHRYSISSKPGKSSTSVDNLTLDKKEHVEKTKEIEEPKNSVVNMPGDFIYFEPKRNEMTTPDVLDKNTKRKVSNNGNSGSSKEVITKTNVPQIPFSDFFLRQDDKKFHILIGATGSVATIKVPMIIDKLFKLYSAEKVSIQLIVTKPAEHFLNGLKISTHVKIWREEDVWSDCKKMGDMILHHELRKWADIFLIAPLSANSLAKIANGINNNLLTAVLRDWSPATPVFAAPAMNTFMYINPMTKKHLRILEEDMSYITVLKPVEKVLICGDIGMGGMREWADIVEIMRRKINEIRKARDEVDATFDKDDDDEDEDDDDEDEDDEDGAAKNVTDSEDDDYDDEDEEENDQNIGEEEVK